MIDDKYIAYKDVRELLINDITKIFESIPLEYIKEHGNCISKSGSSQELYEMPLEDFWKDFYKTSNRYVVQVNVASPDLLFYYFNKEGWLETQQTNTLLTIKKNLIRFDKIIEVNNDILEIISKTYPKGSTWKNNEAYTRWIYLITGYPYKQNGKIHINVTRFGDNWKRENENIIIDEFTPLVPITKSEIINTFNTNSANLIKAAETKLKECQEELERLSSAIKEFNITKNNINSYIESIYNSSL